jgi:hypothetical protein
LQKKKQNNDKMWKICLLKEASIRVCIKEELQYSRDCPSTKNIEEEWRQITEMINKMARECLGTKTKLRRKKACISGILR